MRTLQHKLKSNLQNLCWPGTSKLRLAIFFIFTFMFLGFNAQAHTWEIRVNQNQDGTLTWYLQSYHGVNQCATQNAGIRINGVSYELSSQHSGSVIPLSSTIYTASPSYTNYYNSYGYGRLSYGVVHTPFIAGNLNVQAYSPNVCFAPYYDMLTGNGSFTPPPPPVCTSCPVTGSTNTTGDVSDSGTACDPTDDEIVVNLTVNHLVCADITGDGMFSIVFDPAGANTPYGPFNYDTGITTEISFSAPYGTTDATQVKLIDDDFPCSIFQNLTMPGGGFYGVADTEAPSIDCPANVTLSCDDDHSPSNTGMASGSDNCSAVTIEYADASTQDADENAAGHYNYTITRTWTATDVTGNAISCDQVITVQDVTAPSITCPADITVDCEEDNSSSSTGMATGDDNCSAVTISETSVSTQDADENSSGHYNYTITRSWTATDVTGNAISCDQVITVQDVTSPNVACQSLTVYLDEAGVASVTADDIDNGTEDNCSSFTLTLDGVLDYACEDRDSSFVVTLTATDISGNSSSCTATVTVSDDTLPDDDCDGVSNVCDVCPGGDDSIDNNDDGIADCSQLLNYNDYDSDWYCGNNKIRICHTPPGNQNNPQSICVNKNSLPSHLAHGDAVGPCTSCETNDMVILDSDGKHSTIDASDFGLDGFGIGLYPNPASDKLQIYLTASEFPTKLSIYDVYGKKVWEQEVKPGKVNVEVDLSAKQFSNGMYTVNAYNEIGSQTKQLIITK